MSVDLTDMPGLETAMGRFGEAEELAKTETLVAKPALEQRVEKPALRAAEPEKVEAQTSVSKPTDTPAAADKPAVNTEPDKSQEAVTKSKEAAKVEKAEPEKSRYAKSQERLNKTWESVNAEKATLAADRQKLDAERVEHTRRQAEFQAIQKQAEQPQYKPDDYLQAAAQKRQLADHQRAEAQRLEDAGKFPQAEALRKTAAKNEAIGEDLAEHAETLRQNPPKGFAERSQQFEQARRAWTLEAAKENPDLAKDGSPLQRAVAEMLNGLAKSDPQLMVQPSVIYHAARLAAIQLRAKALEADAARVPGLVKEAESLRAKIKDLEALTTPAGGAGVASLGAEAPGDDYATLRQAAEQGIQFR